MTGILNTTSLSRAAAAALSALLLSGCAALSGGGSEAIPADAMKRPVDLSVVCVLVNEDVKSEPLVKSLETGVRSFGSEPRLLMPGDGPQACSFVVTYEVRTNARAIEAVRFRPSRTACPPSRRRAAPIPAAASRSTTWPPTWSSFSIRRRRGLATGPFCPSHPSPFRLRLPPPGSPERDNNKPAASSPKLRAFFLKSHSSSQK